MYIWVFVFILIALVIFRPIGYTAGEIKPLLNLAPTPPMGWNSWNCFKANISDALIREITDAMVDTGLLDAGYNYIVIDDGWQAQERDEDGNLQSDPERFPHGMKALGDYIHSKGFKFGLYTSVGRTTCEGLPGSYDHEFADMEKFAEWGVDFVKIDWCTYKHIWWPFWNYKLRYSLMTQAIQSTGRPMVISMCNWGFNKPWTWKPEMAHMYRSFYDIKPSENSIETILKDGIKLAHENRPNHWIDLDMLEVGNGISHELAEYHFYWWCKLRSPLMIGCDVRNIDEKDLAILTNEKYIRLNQYGEDVRD